MKKKKFHRRKKKYSLSKMMVLSQTKLKLNSLEAILFLFRFA